MTHQCTYITKQWHDSSITYNNDTARSEPTPSAPPRSAPPQSARGGGSGCGRAGHAERHVLGRDLGHLAELAGLRQGAGHLGPADGHHQSAGLAVRQRHAQLVLGCGEHVGEGVPQRDHLGQDDVAWTAARTDVRESPAHTHGHGREDHNGKPEVEMKGRVQSMT